MNRDQIVMIFVLMVLVHVFIFQSILTGFAMVTWSENIENVKAEGAGWLIPYVEFGFYGTWPLLSVCIIYLVMRETYRYGKKEEKSLT